MCAAPFGSGLISERTFPQQPPQLLSAVAESYPSPLQEQENLELLNRFRMAHSEVEEREQKLQQAEGLNNSIRLELLSSDSERRQLRDSVTSKEREIQQVTEAPATS